MTSPSTPSVRARIRWPFALGVFLLLLAAHLAPVWMVGHFPSQDGPEHVYNAQILREYNWPQSQAFRRYFRINHSLVPNWSTAVLLRGLLAVAAPATADKLLVSGYFVLFFLAGAYAITAVRPWGAVQLLILLPLSYNLTLFLGFYNFEYSLPVLLLIVGLVLRHAEDIRLAYLLVLMALSTLLYFCHIVTFGIEGLFLGLMAIWTAGTSAPGEMRWTPRRLLRAVASLAAMLPGVVLSLLFVTRETAQTPNLSISLHDRLQGFLAWAQAFADIPASLSTLFILALLIATVAVLSKKFALAHAGEQVWSRVDLLLVLAVALAVADLVVPDGMAGGSYIVTRLNIQCLLIWALWLAMQRLAGLGRVMLCGVAGVVALLLVAANQQSMTIQDDYLHEYVAVSGKIDLHSTVLPILYTSVGYKPDGGAISSRALCLLHASAWVAADRQAVEVTDYEAGTGYFPTLFQPGMAPGPWTELTSTAYQRAGKNVVDYVIVWTGGIAPPAWMLRDGLIDQIHTNFELIARSPGRGYVEVYRRKAVFAPAPVQ